AGGAVRPGNDLPEVPAPRAAPPLRQCRRAGRRPAPLPRWPTDPGPAGRRRRARLEVGAAAARHPRTAPRAGHGLRPGLRRGGRLGGVVRASALGFAGVTGALVYALQGWHRADEERTAAVGARTREAEQRDRADRARRQAEANLAFNQLARAGSAWQLNNLA